MLMKWEELPFRERAEYIRVGVKNGLNNIDNIKEAYHKFAIGGNLDDVYDKTIVKSWSQLKQEGNSDLSALLKIDSPNLIPEDVQNQLVSKFHRGAASQADYWFKNREDLVNSNLEDYKANNKLAQEELEALNNNYIKNSINNAKSYKIEGQINNSRGDFSFDPTTPYYKEDRLGEFRYSNFDVLQQFREAQSGNKTKLSTTPIHEFTHAMKLRPMESKIGDIVKQQKTSIKNSKGEVDPYLNNTSEIYSRLMQFRIGEGLNPKEKLEAIDPEIAKKYNLDFGDNGETLLRLHNEVAQNDSNTLLDPRFFNLVDMRDEANYAAYGGNLYENGGDKTIGLFDRALLFLQGKTPYKSQSGKYYAPGTVMKNTKTGKKYRVGTAGKLYPINTEIANKINNSKRIRGNNSPTKNKSEEVEDFIYRYKFNRNMTKPLLDYIPEQSILINGHTTSTNVLDSLAKYAGIHNRNLQLSLKPHAVDHNKIDTKSRKVNKEEALGLGLRETYLTGAYGTTPETLYNWFVGHKDGEKYDQNILSDYDRYLSNANAFTAYGQMPAVAAVNNYHYSHTDKSRHPLLDAFQYYAQGDYNRGKNNSNKEKHNKEVFDAGTEAFKNKEVQKWWNTTGADYFYGRRKALGGKLKKEI